jgi:hypothetical protein
MSKNFGELFSKFRKPDGFDFDKNFNLKILIGIITIVLISLLLPSYKSIDTDYEIGTIWSSEDLIAPFSFPIYRDEVDYEKEKKEAVKKITPVFLDNPVDNIDVRDSVNSFFPKLDEIFSKANKFEKNNENIINSDKLAKSKSDLPIEFTQDEWLKLFKLYRNENKNQVSYSSLKSEIKQTISDFNQKKILNVDKSTITTNEISIKVNGDKLQDNLDIDKVLDRRQIDEQLRVKFLLLLNDPVLESTITKIATFFIKDNLLYDQTLTNLEIQNRIDQIPKTIGIVRENERIVSKHDPITKVTKLKLDSYKKIRLENIGVQDYFIQYIGKILTIFILLVILTMFLYYIRNDVFNSNLKLTLISSLIVLESFISYLSLKLTINAPVELLIFVSVAAILLTIMFDSRLAYFIIVIICFLVAAVRGGDYTIAFVSLGGSVLSIFSVRDIKNRSQIFRSFFFILVGYTIPILALGLDKAEGTQKILTNILFGGINAVMSPIIAYGLLIFYEKVFRVTTDLTLLELADFNQPLLKELSTKAPGTFHHSIVMGNLAEEAAVSIGANRILARVGCYYHDIGKIVDPSYFVENQIERINRHESLDPNTSARIIIAHVSAGIELARKYKLPQVIINFIPMHHGNTLVSFFYSKARNLADSNKEYVPDYLYRYPGPKPQTKETGIAMLADTVEASTKSIENPSSKILEENIDSVIKKRFMEGELDECDLTLKDLTKIKKSFLKILIGIHHQRIKYPEEIKI